MATRACVRHADLRRMLQRHRREARNDLPVRIDDARGAGPTPPPEARQRWSEQQSGGPFLFGDLSQD